MPEEIRADLLLGRDTLSPGLVKAGQAASDASSNVRQLTRDLYEAGKVRATPVVDLNDDEANTKLADVTAKLKELGAKVADPGVNLDDKEAVAGLTAMKVKLDALGNKVASPRITLDGLTRAEAGIAALDLQLDRLSKKHATPSVGGGGTGFLSRLRGVFGAGGAGIAGLFGAAGGTAGGAAQAGGGASSSFGGLGGVAGIIAAIAGGAALLPALLPLGLGVLVGGGATLEAAAIGKKAATQLAALHKSLATAKGPQRAAIQAQIAALNKSSGEVALFGAVQNLGTTAKGAFSSALESAGPGTGTGLHFIPGVSFLTGMEGILKQLAGFIKSIGPQLGDLFRASLPFMQLFVKFLEQAGKILLPVFTQSLREMTPYLPIIGKGLLALVQGFGDMIKAMGPQGMQAAAKTFVALMKAVGGILTVTGKLVNFFAVAVQDTGHWLQQHWKIVEWLGAPIVTAVTLAIKHWTTFRHDTAVIFDLVRHDIATVLHGIATDFDTWRHGWAHIWDMIYSDTIGVVIRLDRDIITWFDKIPGQIKNVFKGALTWLYNAGKDVLQGLWNGLLFIWHKVTSFISGIANWIKQHKGPVHLDASLLEPAGRALMGGLLKGLTGGFGAVASFVGGVAGRIGSAIGSGGVTAAQGIALKMLPGFGWSTSQFGALDALWNRESGWRWNATNPTSGAYGIPQALPASKMAAAGPDWRTNPATQILWGLNYIKSRYGSPAGAWGHELAFGWYDKGGFLPPGLSLAYNATGRPEQVIAHGGAGQTVNVYVTVGHGTHPVAAAQEIAKVLNVGARNGVRLRTSILGPG